MVGNTSFRPCWRCPVRHTLRSTGTLHPSIAPCSGFLASILFLVLQYNVHASLDTTFRQGGYHL